MPQKWENIPDEIKEMIVHRSTDSTRNALRACSTESKALVENKRRNAIHTLQILCTSRKWKIGVYKSKNFFPYQAPDVYRFDSREKLQEGLTEILKGVDSVNKLEIETDISLKLTSSCSKLRVESFDGRRGCGVHVESILSQLEPVYLSWIFIDSDGGNWDIYDLPQVIFAEQLIIMEPSCIRGYQLLNLETRFLTIRRLECSVLQYLKKITLDASTRLPRFQFDGLRARMDVDSLSSPPSETVLLDTDHPQLKLSVNQSDDFGSINGHVLFDSDVTASQFTRCNSSGFRKINQLTFAYDFETKKQCWNINYSRVPLFEVEQEFQSFEEAKEKLDEILANTDHIGTFNLRVKETENPIIWAARDKKLTVSKLRVFGDHSISGIRQLLDQIDPVYVKHLHIDSQEVDPEIFDLPHLLHASYVEIKGSILNDEQLLKINANVFGSTVKSDGSTQNQLLTANALNQYIKKCILDLNEMGHLFVFHELSPDLNADEIFEGLVIHTDESSATATHKWVTLPDSEFILHVEYIQNCLFGVRRRVQDPVPGLVLLHYGISMLVTLPHSL